MPQAPGQTLAHHRAVGMLLVLAVRLIAPLSITRWPFWGTLVTLVADGVDIIIFQLTAFPGDEYQRLDKLLDVYYIAVQLVITQGWPSPVRWVLNILFVYRMVGVAAFEATGSREMLVYFPNVFTFYFAFVAGLRTFCPTYEMSAGRSAVWLGVVLAPTLLLEYSLHWARWFDEWRAVDIIATGRDAVMDFFTSW